MLLHEWSSRSPNVTIPNCFVCFLKVIDLCDQASDSWRHQSGKNAKQVLTKVMEIGVKWAQMDINAGRRPLDRYNVPWGDGALGTTTTWLRSLLSLGAKFTRRRNSSTSFSADTFALALFHRSTLNLVFLANRSIATDHSFRFRFGKHNYLNNSNHSSLIFVIVSLNKNEIVFIK